ncbi:MAG: hypothetical protein IJI75_08725 [Solobacterium sp.]|nr:hypothetical protein [Solobacterium sp.]
MFLIPAVFLPAGCIRPAERPSDPDHLNSAVRDDKPVLSFDSLPDALELSGQTLTEAGLTKDDLTDGIYLLIEAVFLNEKQVIRGYMGSGKDERIGELTFTCKKPFEEAQSYFTGLYEEPYRTELEPYVKSNGGTVCHEYYWTGEGILRLSKAEKYGFFEVRYQDAEKPEEVISHEN